jgi:hypothetical protein
VNGRAFQTALVMAAMVAGASNVHAEEMPIGSLAGQVRSATGIVQMGATVVLYNRYDQVVRQALTTESGNFVFDGLTPDLYSVRVTLASFMPALRRNISVIAGTRSILTINMASVLSSIELFYISTGQGPLMSDDWRWTLRSSTATRPVLRVLPGWDPTGSSSKRAGAVFSETRGLLRVSTGDAADAPNLGTQPDLGTAFALATSVFGTNRVQVSGNLGYAAEAGMPTTGFRTSFSRGQDSPEVSMTVRQMYLPFRAGIQSINGQGDVPVLRTMSLSFIDKVQLSDHLRLEYGSSLDSVTFLDRLNYFSPFARATYDLGSLGSVQVAWQSGSVPTELMGNRTNLAAETFELQHDLTALSVIPRVSLQNGHAQVQRSQNFEVGFQRVEAKRRYGAAVFHETVRNLGLTVANEQGFVDASELLPEMSSRMNVFNAGGFQRMGYMATVSQEINQFFEVAVAGGMSGALAGPNDVIKDNTPDAIRGGLRDVVAPWVVGRLSGAVPVTGTKVVASYGWTDFRTVMPSHIYLTQGFQRDLGWNISVRQPLPAIPGIPGRLEAHAEARNLLANGYLPMTAANGRRALFIQQPRALRGGLSFIF